MRRLIPLLVKAAISGFLLYIALDFVRLETLQQRLSQIEGIWVAAGLFALSVQVIFVAQRWRLIVQASGAEFRPQQALLFTLIGLFFNQALPSTIGGDAARIWLLARTPAGWKTAIHSVLIDRAAGLIWLALLVLICLPWSLDLIQNPVGRTALIMIGFGSIAVLAGLYLLAHVGQDWSRRWRVTRHLAEIAGAAWRVLASVRTGGRVAALSIATHLLTVLAAWCAARAIGSPLDLLRALLLIPPVILIAAIPVSIAGWGVREGALIAAFAYAGLPESEGLIVSLLLGAGIFLTGAFGGLTWILSSQRLRVAPMPYSER
ncbi:MAG: lysylphosphatidylglycerol synthase transmembrane domain-containing protein [Xanthobacteraceae bacterium]